MDFRRCCWNRTAEFFSHDKPEHTGYEYVVKNSGIVVLEANRKILVSEIKQKTMRANISDVIVIIYKGRG